jgi:lipoprotein-anchoring transpeptidase ErfK/SrfK
MNALVKDVMTRQVARVGRDTPSARPASIPALPESRFFAVAHLVPFAPSEANCSFRETPRVYVSPRQEGLCCYSPRLRSFLIEACRGNYAFSIPVPYWICAALSAEFFPVTRVMHGRAAAVRRRQAALTAVAALAVLAAGGVVIGCSGGGRPAASSVPSSEGTVAALPAVAASPGLPSPGASAVPASTQVATVQVASARYSSPGQLGSGTVPASWEGRPSVLPVLATVPGWVRVRLAQRPNGSTAWLPASDVRLSSTPYVIVVNLTTTRLSLYDQGRRVFTAPAGVGTPDDPTPSGGYFIAFTEAPPQPNPGYGPFIIVTSAHSPKIADWEGSGDAVIGIHGPLGEDTQIGTTGARISHGCIRLHDVDLEQLSSLPAGTPIDVIRSPAGAAR